MKFNRIIYSIIMATFFTVLVNSVSVQGHDNTTVFNGSESEELDCPYGEPVVSVTAILNIHILVNLEEGNYLYDEAVIAVFYLNGYEVDRRVVEWTDTRTGRTKGVIFLSWQISSDEEWRELNSLQGGVEWRLELPSGVSARNATSGKIYFADTQNNESTLTVNLINNNPVNQETQANIRGTSPQTGVNSLANFALIALVISGFFIVLSFPRFERAK